VRGGGRDARPRPRSLGWSRGRGSGVACRAGRPPGPAYGILGFGVLTASLRDGAMDLRCASLVFSPSQQQQQEEDEVLVPHQELPNGTQPMEGSMDPFSRLLHVIMCYMG